jgi:predicted GH43/DUF377 family glycosyl hydrolase
MKNLLVSLLFLFLIVSCKDETSVTSQESLNGKVVINFDKAAIPQETYLLVASLSRAGQDSIRISSYVSSQSSTNLIFNYIVPGTWQLKVWAFDQAGVPLYYGYTKIDVLPNEITKASVTLFPTGLVNVTINWGAQILVNDFSGNPLITTNNFSATDLNGVFFPIVHYVGGKYKMWYSKWYSDRSYNIEYAESQDGVKWTKVINYPVLERGSNGSWDQYGASGGPVNYENGMYTMYYVGVTSKDGDSYIGAADSFDGIYWVKRPTPLIKTLGKRVAPNSLIKIGSTYYLYFSYTKLNSSQDTWGISLATSQDGANWTVIKENVLPYSESWEYPNPNGCSVILHGNKWLMLYGTLGNQAIGTATSLDGINWMKNSSNPVFTYNNTHNHWSNDVRYPYILQIENSYKLYYTGSVNGKLAIAVGDLIIK